MLSGHDRLSLGFHLAGWFMRSSEDTKYLDACRITTMHIGEDCRAVCKNAEGSQIYDLPRLHRPIARIEM